VGEVIQKVLRPLRVSRSEIKSTIEDAEYVVIAGAGLTGEAAKKYFSSRGLKTFVVADALPAENSAGIHLISEIEAEIKAQKGKGISLFSPGISPSGALAQKIFALNLPSVSELDLLCEFAGEPLVGVTGTNGKSTTTTLVSEMLSASNLKQELIGNIGVPFIEALNRPDLGRRVFVSEISSYQLEWAESISPKVGIFLNLAPNHLERHLTMQEYFQSKLKLIATLNKDSYAIINADDPHVSKIRSAEPGRILWFGHSAGSGQNTNAKSEEYSRLSKDGMTLEVSCKLGEFIFDLSKTPLLGLHNKMNFAASIPASLIAGATVQGINKVISTFSGLEHRLESVPNRRKLRIINDSKATTATATATDLKGVLDSTSDQPITLMVGGLMKIGSWSGLFEEVAKTNRVKKVLFFGKDGQQIMEELEGLSAPRAYHGSMTETLKVALAQSDQNEIILFAPGCPSFDAYSGFEERGRHFKSLVQELAA
jgi:UDP-N-acetylmuramoylalanine--D-glutamate ligase